MTTGWSSWLAGPRLEPVTRRDEQEEPSKLRREGGASQGAEAVGVSLRTHCGCGLGGRAHSPWPLERVNNGATEAPPCAPGPWWAQGHPPPALFSTFLLRFCLFGMGPSVPLGLLSLIKESRRTGGVSSTIVLSLMVH